ncbi:hypothetical protein V6N12_073271 [Hibiscus sabdariffa]|uniref:TraB family protein n=1 Tax=Hibiscus sabdariffa TaxID=183260 RepID=A0ABR2B727_9ROSI
MNRLTRSLNSVSLRGLLRSLSLDASFTKPRCSQATLPLPHAKHFTPSCSNKPLDFSTFASTANRPSFKPELPELDPPSVENFIHVVEASSDHNNIDHVSRSKGSDSSQRRNADLPEELSKNVVHLSCESSADGGKCDVYLVGTIHESCRDVEAAISYLKPQVVFLELCSSRVGILHVRDVKDIKTARLLEVVPGSEFRVAYEEARKYGAKVILGDRPIHLKDMEEDHKGTRGTQEFKKIFPTLFETLDDERNRYMSYTLLGVARKHSSIVAVVGRAHLHGIRKYWKQSVSINELMTIPPQKPTLSTSKILASPGFAVAGAAIVWGIYLASKM